MNKFTKAQGIIIAGVGGQGALTVAQLLLGVAWKSKYHVLQSEVHGMSQRGGAVNAQVLFDTEQVTSPIVMDGTADYMVAMEPLEALRYLPLMSKNAVMVVAINPIKNMANYPEVSTVIQELETVPGVLLVDMEKYAKELNYRNAGNMVLLGALSKSLPFTYEIWKEILAERFKDKGEKVIEQNLQAFDVGRKL